MTYEDDLKFMQNATLIEECKLCDEEKEIKFWEDSYLMLCEDCTEKCNTRFALDVIIGKFIWDEKYNRAARTEWLLKNYVKIKRNRP